MSTEGQEVKRLFSQREGLKKTNGLLYKGLPQAVRNALYNILFDLSVKTVGWVEVYKDYCNRKGIICSFEARGSESASVATLLVALKQDEWWEFFDLIEYAFVGLRDAVSTKVGKPPLTLRIDNVAVNHFERQVNDVLNIHHIGYRMRNGKMERVVAPSTQAEIDKAKKLLAEPEFAGAAEHFAKAIEFFGKRPKADYENCVKEAVSAIESVARIICGKPKETLSKLIPQLVQQGVLVKPLNGVVERLYAYRGDAPGAAHGKTGVESPIGVPEAEFVLGLSASTINYLIRKRQEKKGGA